MSKKFYFYIFAAMTLWSGSWVSGKLLSGGSLHFQFIFWRFVITAVSFLFIYLYMVYVRKEESNLKKIPKNPLLAGMLLISGIALTGYNAMFILGLASGLAGKGGVIVTALNPLIGFIIGVLIFGNKFKRRSWIGIAIGITGGIILIEPWKYSLNQLIDGGNLIFIAAALFWASLTALGHKVQKYLSLWEFNLLTYIIALFLTIPMVWNKNIFSMSQYTAGFWINTLYLALMAGTLAGGIYFYASRKIGSAKTGSFTFLVPGMALLFSYLFLGEIPEISTVTGGILAVSAVYIINKSS